jgi:hypothetical protein
MATTISGTHTMLQILNPGTPSVIITGTIKAGGTLPATLSDLKNGFGAVYGPASAHFTVTNSGLIDDTETGTTLANAGIVLGASGSIDNLGTVLSPGGEGIFLYAGGDVTNSGWVAGEDDGLLALGIATLTNSGTLSASGTTFVSQGETGGASGAALLDGGDIDNLAGGKIIGLEIGVGADGFISVSNAGLIETTGTSTAIAGTITFAPIGIDALKGAAISNTGSITGAGEAILIESTLANVVNSGLIMGTGTTFDIDGNLSPSEGIFLLNGGTVTNQATGTISGYGAGIQSGSHFSTAGERTLNSTISTTVINSGLIESGNSSIEFSSGNGVFGTAGGVVLNAGGTVVNAATGTISGHFGVYINGGSSKIGNGVDNLGRIIGVSDSGVILGQNASLVNSGQISGANYGVFLYAANRLTNSGNITGTFDGILANNDAGLATTVTNSGLIEATGTTNIVAGTNTFAPVGIEQLTGGTVSNSGSILGGAFGILLESAVASGSTVINSGMIAGDNRIFVNGTNTYASFGIDVVNGGVVTNTSTGTIAGAGVGVVANANTLNAPVTLINDGVIKATGMVINDHGSSAQPWGIILKGSEAVTNQAGGIISGYDGAYLATPSTLAHGSIDNLGSIAGSGDFGVMLEQAASLTNSGHITGAIYGMLLGGSNLVSNLAGGTIAGANAGILTATSPSGVATIVNAGEIIATAGTFVKSGQTLDSWGAQLIEGGTFSNAATGILSGFAGFQGGTGTTLINAGTITGKGGTAVDFTGTNDKLIDDPGAVFSGLVHDAGNTGILELAAGSKTGTIASFNSQFQGFATLEIDSGANWDLAGTIVTLLNSGSLAVSGSAGINVKTVSNAGSITAASGTALNAAAAATITNTGVIKSASSLGIDLALGGVLNNSGQVSGSSGFVASGKSSVTNSGTISASGMTLVVNGGTGGASAIGLLDGGTVNNLAGGKMIALEIGVGGTSTSGIATTVDNSGLIEVTGTKTAVAGTITFSPIAVDLLAGGTVSNSSTGTIIGGGIGILLGNNSASGQAVINGGLITGDSLTFVSGTATYGSGGIIMLDGGAVTNTATGTISADEVGVVFRANTLKAAGTLINAGLIKATGGTIINNGTLNYPVGINLTNGGSATNQSTGIISGYAGVYVTGGTASLQSFIDNAGTITGINSTGVILEESASLTNSGHITGALYGMVLGGSNLVANLTGGTITGGHAGIVATNGLGLAATVANSGDILGGSGTFVISGTVYDDWGAELIEGGTFSNAASGLVEGYAGFVGEAGTTLINAGEIVGTGSGVAAYLVGAGDKVVDDPGASFVGFVGLVGLTGLVDDVAGTGILELASGSTVGTIAAFNSEFLGFPTVDVDTGANWTVGGTIATLLNDGTLAVTSGSSLDISSAVNASSSGIFLLSGKASLEIAALLGTNVKIEFLAVTPSSKLAIDTAAQFGVNVGKSNYAGPLLEDFKAGDVIDLKNIAATGLKLNYSTTTGTLQISNSSGGIVASLQFQNSSLGTGSFQAAADSSHGTFLTLN